MSSKFDAAAARWLAAHASSLIPVERSGAVLGTTGELITAHNLNAPIGARCRVTTQSGIIGAEVVGFDGQATLLMADCSLRGLQRGDPVTAMSGGGTVSVGAALLGRVLDAYGNPLDGRPPPRTEQSWPLDGVPINPMQRQRLHAPLDVGVQAINGLTTLGVGMRTGLFAGSGVGKSTLLGMIARHAEIDCCVMAMIGERGREVREFIDDHLGAALARSVVVVSAADTPPLARILGAQRAVSIAEAFRAEGRNVLLLVDSLTRLAMAGREIGLLVGEPAATRGYPPSVFARLASYIERAGMGAQGQGSITGLYTVLVEGDDHVGDPVADAARSVLDGHIVLSRRMSEAGIYPPIDVSMSLSRPMSGLVDPGHVRHAARFRLLWSRLQEKRELVDIGAYAPGRDSVLDEALSRAQRLEAFLRQGSGENIRLDATLAHLTRIVS
ncbi:FliI/YscN family ATPase [Thioclava sp. BHET1]|nr:FliI/YscN family ATPase [Thioclava sp. BHET1]